MKYKLIIALVGGIAGFTFHLIWHFKLNIPLLFFSSHISTGIFHTIIGIIIGGLIGYFIEKKRK